jgi:predicted amidophosphoribosyltransferase
MPSQNWSFKSKYYLEKVMNPWELPFTKHEYCGECFKEWQETETFCQNCAAKGIETLRYRGTEEHQKEKRTKKHYFLSFNIIEQLQQMLKRKYIVG